VKSPLSRTPDNGRRSITRIEEIVKGQKEVETHIRRKEKRLSLISTFPVFIPTWCGSSRTEIRTSYGQNMLQHSRRCILQDDGGKLKVDVKLPRGPVSCMISEKP
jgi:hypothetical protein